jgi:HAD superfamily hydrolase (TIGR01484 family)
MMQTLGTNYLEADLQIIGPELKYILDAMDVDREKFKSQSAGETSGFVTIVEDVLTSMNDLPSKLTFIGTAQGIHSLQASLDGKPLRASISGQNYLDVTPENADKGAAVRQLLAMMNIDSKAVGAVGDGHNDISMFREVTFPIAMGNSLEEVQSAARLTAPTNDQEGVAWAIHTILDHNQTA